MAFLSRRRHRSGKWKCYCEFPLRFIFSCCLSLSLLNKFSTIPSASGPSRKINFPRRQLANGAFPSSSEFSSYLSPPPTLKKTKEAHRSNHSSLRPRRSKGDLAQLSAEGHFLKGSSATLGLNKVKDSCEKIQHYGQHKDETGTIEEPDDAKCLGRIKKTLDVVRVEYAEVEKVLRRFYHEHV